MYSGFSRFLSVLSASAILLSACSPGAEAASVQPEDRQFFAMTTIMELKAYGTMSDAALDEAEDKIHDLDSLLSVGNKGSEVWQINHDEGGILSDDTAALTEASLNLYQETGGAFDFTIYPIMDLWGFTRLFDESQAEGAETEENTGALSENERLLDSVPTKDQISAVLPHVGSSKVSYDQTEKKLVLPGGTRIDFGGIAKGYASQQVMDIFKAHGLTGGLANLGGNIQICGKKPDGNPWRIGIEDPEDTSATIGILSLTSDAAVITSGGYERYLTDRNGKHYSHIIDPATGYPVDNDLSSVTIVCNDGTLADGLSTSLCVMGKDKAISFWKKHSDQFDMILLDTDRKITISEGLEDSFKADAFDVSIVKAG